MASSPRQPASEGEGEEAGGSTEEEEEEEGFKSKED